VKRWPRVEAGWTWIKTARRVARKRLSDIVLAWGSCNPTNISPMIRPEQLWIPGWRDCRDLFDFRDTQRQDQTGLGGKGGEDIVLPILKRVSDLDRSQRFFLTEVLWPRNDLSRLLLRLYFDVLEKVNLVG